MQPPLKTKVPSSISGEFRPLGVCYSKASGRFFSYLTNPEYKLAIDTKRGILVISPLDKAGLAKALTAAE